MNELNELNERTGEELDEWFYPLYSDAFYAAYVMLEEHYDEPVVEDILGHGIVRDMRVSGYELMKAVLTKMCKTPRDQKDALFMLEECRGG